MEKECGKVQLWRVNHSSEVIMECSSPSWTFEDDVQSFQYYTQQLTSMWPQKIVISGILSTACTFFYADAMLFWIWFLAISADFLVGVLRAFRVDGRLDGRKFRKGALKLPVHIMYLLIVGSAGVSINIFLENNGIPTIPLLNAVLVYFTCTELVSITKNLEMMGFDTPPIISKVLNLSLKRSEKIIEKLHEEPDESKNREDGDIR